LTGETEWTAADQPDKGQLDEGQLDEGALPAPPVEAVLAADEQAAGPLLAGDHHVRLATR
jgi:hypothetical protein